MKVAIVGTYPAETYKKFEEHFAGNPEIEVVEIDTQEKFDALTEADAIILRIFKMPKEVIARIKGLKMIMRWGAGFDSVDVEEAGKRGIRVCNTPGANAYAVAELTVALMLAVGRKLICHYCGYETAKPDRCPVCSSPYIGGFKAGTQQIQQVVEKEFPEARVLRMDYDTTRNKGSYEQILSSFAAHEADILVGTQMIVKGHDFPDVTLVGAVAADLSLNAADYRCAERTFQLLTQAVGRSGRGNKPGEAVIQTYHPEHYSIQTAATQDYEAFYREEMSYRLLMDYPPAAHMLSILAAGEDEELLSQGMDYLGRFVERIGEKYHLHVIGPAYASVGKINDVYHKVIYLKHQEERVLMDIKDKAEKYIEVNSGFRKLYIQFDYS